MMSFFAAITILITTWAAMRLAERPSGASSISGVAVRCGSAGIAVGIVYLIGNYASEFAGGKGLLSLAFVIGVPLVVSLMHFPGKRAVALAIPVFGLGLLSLVLVAIVTQIPLD